MNPTMVKEKTVFRIIDRQTGGAVGSYSRSYHDEFDFDSAEGARTANCHGMFEDKNKYRIAKYRVTYELLEDDVDANKVPDQQPEAGTCWFLETSDHRWLSKEGFTNDPAKAMQFKDRTAATMHRLYLNSNRPLPHHPSLEPTEHEFVPDSKQPEGESDLIKLLEWGRTVAIVEGTAKFHLTQETIDFLLSKVQPTPATQESQDELWEESLAMWMGKERVHDGFENALAKKLDEVSVLQSKLKAKEKEADDWQLRHFYLAKKLEERDTLAG